MKVVIRSVAFIGAYLLPVGVLYWFLAEDDYAGVLLLLLGGVAMLALAAYLVGASTGHGPDPADHDQAPPGAGPGGVPGEAVVVGRFPSASIWPAVIGLGATVAAFGAAFTEWIAVPGLLLVALGLAGYAREAV